MQDTPESVYESFWKDLVETDGVMDPEKIKAELCDYRMVMQNAVKVYLHITNGKIGKLNTDPDVVCQIADECYEEQLEDGCPCHEPPAKESRFVQVACWCERCELAANHGMATRMSLCPECGDKRCSRAEFHENQCDKAPDTQRTDPPNCDWHRDEFGNWFSGCSDTMPDFTPWPGTDPNGAHCPKCGKAIATKVHDKP